MLKFQNKIYAVSRDFTVFGLYYNKDMFAQSGVPYPDETWDWNTFLEAAKKLTKDTNGDGKIDQFGFSPEPWLDSFIYWIWENGGEIVSEDLKTCIINQPEAVEALQFIADMRTKYKVAPSVIATQQPGQGSVELMSAGKLGMYVNGSWMISELRKKAKFKWDVAPVPKGPKGRATVLFTVGMVIPTESRHPEEAWEFLKYLGGAAGQSFFGSTKIASGIPAIKSIAESTVFKDASLPPEHIEVLLQAASDYARPLRLVPEMSEIYEVLQPATDELWLGKKTAKQVATELKPKIDKILTKPVP
jgi:multiple sugar transport system substrate-binding protein